MRDLFFFNKIINYIYIYIIKMNTKIKIKKEGMNYEKQKIL